MAISIISILQQSTGYPRIVDLDDVECHLNGPISNNTSPLPILQVHILAATKIFSATKNISCRMKNINVCSLTRAS